MNRDELNMFVEPNRNFLDLIRKAENISVTIMI